MDWDVSNLDWSHWWMLISAAMILVGFIGRQAVQAWLGAKQIAARRPDEAQYSVLEEQVLSGRVANRAFKRQVGRKALRTRAGRLFFWLLVAGIVAHAAFWVYAAVTQEGGAAGSAAAPIRSFRT